MEDNHMVSIISNLNGTIFPIGAIVSAPLTLFRDFAKFYRGVLDN